jgi:hypothetical protein
MHLFKHVNNCEKKKRHINFSLIVYLQEVFYKLFKKFTDTYWYRYVDF